MKMQCYPIIVGGSGGSGTRVVAQLLQSADIYMGDQLNNSLDALEFVKFYDRWINIMLRKDIFGSSTKSSFKELAIHDEFSVCLEQLLKGRDKDILWGWKNPRSMFLLPFFKAYFNRIKFIHIVRDGRDMAFSTNQNQYRKHADSLLGDLIGNDEQCVDIMAFWVKSNMAVLEYAEKYLDRDYLCIRFEDLCDNPDKTIRIIAEFLGLSGESMVEAKGIISKPNTIGRWRNYPEKDINEMTKIGEQALARFRYL